jgi:hypothetical protein
LVEVIRVLDPARVAHWLPGRTRTEIADALEEFWGRFPSGFI